MPDSALELQYSLVPSKMDANVKGTIRIERRQNNEKIDISFPRTIRVQDNQDTSELPPGLGYFPLYAVKDYEDTLPAGMTSKGGCFLPMFKREAMWIAFESKSDFAVKVHVGGVNALSGESRNEDMSTTMRRQKLLSEGKSIQDYIVTPGQLWLDGIPIGHGRVRQFVAMPTGSGFSLEAQVTSRECVAGIQFEVIPRIKPSTDSYSERRDAFQIFVKTSGKIITMKIHPSATIAAIKEVIREKEGIPAELQRLIYSGERLYDARSLSDYNIGEASIVHLVLTLRGGGCLEGPASEDEMGLAPGGLIRQNIVQDLSDVTSSDIWDYNRRASINVQILNSEAFTRVTGLAPPSTPITEKTYSEMGLPFFQFYKETSHASVNFVDGIQSVQQIQKIKDKDDTDEPSYSQQLQWLDHDGRAHRFRTAADMKRDIAEMNWINL